MRIRDLVVALVVAATACAHNPDPRSRPIEAVQRDGHGGWIAITSRDDTEIAGELIAVEAVGLRVLAATPQVAIVFIPKAAIRSARLWAWDTKHGGLLFWGGVGGLSTATHGFFLVFSFPTWTLASTVAASIESRASLIEYPESGWDRFSIWARFPQGLPVGLRDGDLLHQERPPLAPALTAPAPTVPSPTPPSPPAPSPPLPSPPVPSPPVPSRPAPTAPSPTAPAPTAPAPTPPAVPPSASPAPPPPSRPPPAAPAPPAPSAGS